MSEEPAATPEPVPWGDEEDPFPEGTVISRPAPEEVPTDRIRQPVRTEWAGPTKIVYVDGFGFTTGEIQGRIEEEGWEIAGREEVDG